MKIVKVGDTYKLGSDEVRFVSPSLSGHLDPRTARAVANQIRTYL
jgi:hypothetical protein